LATASSALAPQVILPIIAGLAATVVFVRRCLRIDYALIDPRLFTNRTFSSVSGTFFLTLVAGFGGLLILPLYLQSIRGLSPWHTGMLVTPAGLGGALAIPVAGLLAERVSLRLIIPTGLLLTILSVIGLARLSFTTSFTYLALDLAVLGAGIGTMMVPMFTGAMGSLSKEQVARASMTINILQQVGASIGTALMAVILTHELDIRGLGRGGIGTQALKRLNPLQDHVAAQAFAHTFAYSIPMLGVALLAGVVFLPRKRREHIPIEVAEEAAQSFIPLA
jgi:MFS family permease